MKYIGATGARGVTGAMGAIGAVSGGPKGSANCIDGRITQLVTDVLQVDPTAPEPELIARAAECLRAGGLVAFPTETVYGLGAHALDRRAVQRVFAAKERPANDPLIVHVAAVSTTSRRSSSKSPARARSRGPLLARPIDDGAATDGARAG
jgi:hypothetical protein